MSHPAPPMLGPWSKGVGDLSEELEVSRAAERRWRLLDGEVMLPCAILKASALAANAAAMAVFLEQTGAELWPHLKTTMSPELCARQIRDGARGVTVATVQQMEVMLRHGQRRLLIANQVVGSVEIRRIAHALASFADLELMVLADSVEGVEHMRLNLPEVSSRPPGVLVEVGRSGARTGVRSLEVGLEVARCVARAPNLRLLGVEAYEGIVPGPDQHGIEEGVASLFEAAIALAGAIGDEGLFSTEEIILSGGGSQYPDMAALALKCAGLGRPTRVILRSGCYLTHDDGWLARYRERMEARSPTLVAGAPAPRAALEVWAHVQSRPEPTRAFATLGKRDVSYDIDLPVLKSWFRRGLHLQPQGVPDRHAVVMLNDQHAYLNIPEDSPLQVGDLLAFGVSHPCTTFDKWRAIPIVDDDYRVTSYVSTWF